MSEKTNEPTPRRLREAAEKGQVARSRLFTSAAVTLGGLGATAAFADQTAVRLLGWSATLLSTAEMDPAGALRGGVEVLARCAAPTLVGALGGSLASAAVTTGGLRFTPGVLAPKLERVSVLEGAKRLCSLRQLADVAKGLGVAVLVAWFLWAALREAAPDVFRAMALGGEAALPAVVARLAPSLLKASALLLLLGLGDWALARRRHHADLKMSHAEVKQEHKSAEGDPRHKSKRKALHKQLASGGPARGVQHATAIVVNPTHIAVALRYAEDECDAPYIVARGREEDAFMIRQQAAALGLPVVRDVPLARSLVQYDVGEAIPEELYQAAAAVLSVALEQTPSRTVDGREPRR